MSAQLLRVVMEFFIVLFYFSIQGQVWMISLLLVQLLSKKGNDVDIGTLLEFNNEVKHFLTL